MTLRVGVDFDGDNWVGIYNEPTDAPNLFGATSVRIDDLYRRVSGAGGSAAGALNTAYDALKYGPRKVQWTVGTANPAYVELGFNGLAAENTGTLAAGQYTGAVWVIIESGLTIGDYTLDLRTGGSTLVASSSSSTIGTAGLVRMTVTGTKVGTDFVSLRLTRTGATTSRVIGIYGAMVVAGAAAPTWFNAGADSLVFDISAYVNQMNWQIGFSAPYQYVAPVGRATITLINQDKRFSPEYSSGAYFGDLLPNRRLVIAELVSGDVLFTGWTDTWRPDAGVNSGKYAVLEASDTRRFLEKKKIFPALATTVTSPTAVAAVVAACLEPEAYALGYEASDLFSLSPPVSVPYYFDSNPDGDDAVRLLGDICGGTQTRLYSRRNGTMFYTMMRVQDSTTADTEIDAAWMMADYRYGETIINDCTVQAHPRNATTGTGLLLWSLEESITLAAGESETLRAYFVDTDSDSRVGGHTLTANLVLLAGAGVTMTLSSTAAQSTDVTFTNSSGGSRTVTDSTTITGGRVRARRPISRTYQDATSITANGTRAERLAFKWVATRDSMKKLAKYRVTRFKDPRGEMQSVTLDGNVEEALVLSAAIGTKVRVTDDQTSHSGIYEVVGERHVVMDGLTDWVADLVLEPVTELSPEGMTLP